MTSQTIFQDRLARIASGAGTTKTTVFVGSDLAFTYITERQRRSGAVTQVARNAQGALAKPAAMIVGFLAHGFERYADFILRGVSGAPANIDIEMTKIALTGACIALVASYLLGLRDRSLLAAKLIGVGLGMAFFHNLVHAWPQVFDMLYSPLWVAKVTTMTEAGSIYFRGMSFAF